VTLVAPSLCAGAQAEATAFIDGAVARLGEMATFDGAGVTENE